MSYSSNIKSYASKPIYLNVGLVLLAIYLVTQFLKYFKNTFNSDSEEQLQSHDRFSESGATITAQQAQIYASELKNALVYEGFSDSWELIKPTLNKLHTNANFNKVYNAFGLIQYSMTWGNIGDPLTSKRYNLIQILSNELKDWQKAELAQNYAHLGIF